MTRVFAEAGVPMLTGSDARGAGWLVPGVALQREFDELADAGVLPTTVLRMATSAAGEYLGQPDRVGTLPGAKADVVVLAADPRDSVAYLHGIEGVVRSGRYRAREALDAILRRAAQERPWF